MFMRETHLTAEEAKKLTQDQPPVEVIANRKDRRAEQARMRRKSDG